MSKTVDERVVEMRFDNQQFERNVQTSMSSLDKLKQSLNMTGAAKGMNELNSAAKNFDLSGMDTSVGSVHTKFSALQVVGVTALANIANSAVNTGKKVVSALAIEPITTGFQEYETKIGSIQTIMSNTANKGETMKSVTKVIDELNTYADKTIYNFSEMTRNIGTFTAAGVGLKESASAIQGIANLAAASGSSSQQASTAMYQLSQALAAGKVGLQDWNSVVNAGMGGEKFQEALKQTAREHGIAVDKIIKKQGSFRESLKEGWMTADVLNDTLNKFTVDGAKKYAASMVKSGKYTDKQAKALIKEAQSMENAATKVKTFTQLWDTLKESAQSGWGQTWEIVVGNFDEAKELFTEVSKVLGGMIDSSAKARNALLKGWKDDGGRKALIDSLSNAFKGLLSIAKPIKEAFREVFPPVTVKQLVSFSKGLRDLTAKMILNDEQSKKLKAAFKGLFSIIKVGNTFIKDIGSGAIKILKNFSGLGNAVLTAAGAFGEFFININESIQKSDVLGAIIDKIANAFTWLANAIKSIGGSDAASGIFDSLLASAKNVGPKITEAMHTIWDALCNAFETGNVDSLLNTLQNVLFAGILLKIKNFIGSFTKTMNNSGKGFIESLQLIPRSIANIFGEVGKSLQVWQQNLKAQTLLKIAGAIGILALSLVVLSGIDSKKLNDALAAITILFIELSVAIRAITGIKTDFVGIYSATFAMIGMSTAIFILAGALKKLSSLNMTELSHGLIGVAGLTAIVIIFAKSIQSKEKTVLKGALVLNAFATAMKILASVCKDLSTLSWEQMAKGLSGVMVLMAVVSEFLTKTDFKGKSILAAVGMVIMAGALKILETSVSKFGNMKIEVLAKGLTAIGSLLTEISLFTRVTGNAKQVIKTALALTIIGSSLYMIVKPLKKMAALSWEEIGKGLASIAGALAILTIATYAIRKPNTMEIASAITVLTGSLIPIASALKKLSKLSWEQLAVGLSGLAGSMIILCTAMHFMEKSVTGAVAMVIVSSSLVVMATALNMVSKLGVVGIATSLGTLAGTFIILGVALAVLKPLIPSMFALSGSIVTLSLSFAALGVSLTVIGAGILSFITSFVGGMILLGTLSWGTIAKGLVTLAGIFLTIGVAATLLKPLIPTILSLSGSIALLGLSCVAVSVAIAMIVAALGALAAIGEQSAAAAIATLETLIVGFFEMIPNILPALFNAVKELILGLVDVLTECVQPIVDGIFKMLLGVLDSLVQYGPAIIDKLLLFIIEIIQGLTKRIPQIVQEGAKLLGSILNAIMTEISKMGTENITQALINIGIIAAFIAALSLIKSLIPGAMIAVVGMGLVIAELSLVLAAIGKLNGIPGLQELVSSGGNLLQAIGTAIGQFIGGILGGIAEGATAALPNIATHLSSFMTNITPFIDGASKIDAGMMSGVKSLAETILILTAAEIMDSLTSWFTGGTDMVAFAEQLVPFGKAMAEYGKTVADINPDVVEASANAAKALAEMADNIPNEGGWIASVIGDNTLAQFAAGLVPFGENMTKYYNAIKGIKPDIVEASASAGKALAEMAQSIPNDGGWIASVTGDNKLSDFAEQMIPFGKSLNSYYKNVKGLEAEPIKESAEAAKSLSKLAKSLSNTGGWISKVFGDNKLSDFAKELIPFAKSLKEYSNVAAGIDPEAINNSSTAASKLAEAVNSMSTINTSGVEAFKKSIDSLSKTNIKGFVNNFTASSSKMESSGINMVNSIVEGIKSKKMALSNVMKAIISTTIKVANSRKGEFAKVGSELMARFVSGMNKYKTMPKSAIASSIKTAVSSIRSGYQSFYSAGAYLVSGFCKGISTNSYKVAATAKTMAEASERAARKELKINSPSKVFMKIGGSVPEGFAKGIDKCGYYVVKSVKSMSKNSLDKTKQAISNIASVLDTDIDTQPTIRPVVDLSNVSSSASAINSMFGQRYALGVASDVGAINAMMNASIQNGGNSDVISAIDKLRKEIGNVGSTTYQVNGITYDDGSNISDAVKSLVRAAKIERRI